MFFISFGFFGFFVLVLCDVSGEIGRETPVELPTWIKENPGFKNPTAIDSVKSGNGTITETRRGNFGWLVRLNEKKGLGVRAILEGLTGDPDSRDFLLIAPWPLTTAFKGVKLYTGNFKNSTKDLHILNTNAFYVLLSANGNSPKMTLHYFRYGNSLEVTPPPIDDPVEKETVFEIQLKGKPPEEYLNPEMLSSVKEAMKAIARRYCAAQGIPFNDTIPTQEMVRIHTTSFCPFEWPDRDVCVSLMHSVFVSGSLHSRSYELTAENLKKMWTETKLTELHDMGLEVFVLPQKSSTVLYWSLIVGLIITSSLLGSCIFWKVNRMEVVRAPRNSFRFTSKKPKKSRLKLAKHQRIPSFMYSSPGRTRMEAFQPANGDLPKTGNSSEPPIKNYFGSILFSSNKAFEEDEDDPIELRPKANDFGSRKK